VPVRKGSIPDAPEGGHRTQPGALLVGAVLALPDAEPAEPRDTDTERALTAALAAPPAFSPPDAVPLAEPPAAVPVAAPAGAGECAAAVAGLAEAAGDVVEPVEPAPRLTTPLRVTLPGPTAFCAAAEDASATESSIA
jgi:hypothetical protein